VIKWTPRAIELGAEPCIASTGCPGAFRERRRRRRRHRASSISPANRYSTCGNSSASFRNGCRIDAGDGSAAYLPMIDGASYKVSLSASGGLVARPADQASADKLKKAGW
jgi:hypothetical protein